MRPKVLSPTAALALAVTLACCFVLLPPISRFDNDKWNIFGRLSTVEAAKRRQPQGRHKQKKKPKQRRNGGHRHQGHQKQRRNQQNQQQRRSNQYSRNQQRNQRNQKQRRSSQHSHSRNQRQSNHNNQRHQANQARNSNPDDYYNVLNVRKSSTAKQIKSAYKKLALKYHVSSPVILAMRSFSFADPFISRVPLHVAG